MNIKSLSRIVETATFFRNLNYVEIELPWTASKAAMETTIDLTHVMSLSCNGADYGLLVGSAEQAFIQKMIDGELSPGKYQSFTPCFRPDPVDELHQTYFTKLELCELVSHKTDMDECQHRLDYITRCCRGNFTRLVRDDGFDDPNVVHIVKTHAGYDIEINNIEIGSYGIRQFGKFTWIYATGIAEPRFGKAVSQLQYIPA